MTRRSTRQKLDADGYDAFTGWRKVLCLRWSEIKRRHRRRWRHELRHELDTNRGGLVSGAGCVAAPVGLANLPRGGAGSMTDADVTTNTPEGGIE